MGYFSYGLRGRFCHTLVRVMISVLFTRCSCLDNATTTTSTSTNVGALFTATPSGTPDATGTATLSAITLHQSGFADYTSPWTLSVSIFREPGGITPGLSVSWPDPHSDEAYSDFCAVWIPHLIPENFTGVNPSAAGSGNCSSLLGSGCVHDLLTYMGVWGAQIDCGRTGVPFWGFAIPESCQGISGRANMTALVVGHPTNNTAQTAYYGEPTDASNASAVFETAMHRIWPVFILEQLRDPAPGTVPEDTANLACVQALNLTSKDVSGGNSASSSATVTGGGSSTSSTAGISTIGTTKTTGGSSTSTSPAAISTSKSGANAGSGIDSMIMSCVILLSMLVAHTR